MTMKTMIALGIKPVDSLEKDSGKRWTFIEKLFLGLTPRQYFFQALLNPMNWLLGLVMLAGFPFIAERFLFGLGSVTHASNDYPWGIFLGFGLFTMVPLSASGFMLGTSVEVFGRHDWDISSRSSTSWSTWDSPGGSPTRWQSLSVPPRSSSSSAGTWRRTSRCRLPKSRPPSSNG